MDNQQERFNKFGEELKALLGKYGVAIRASIDASVPSRGIIPVIELVDTTPQELPKAPQDHKKSSKKK